MAQQKLNIPDIRSLDPDKVVLRYDDDSDTMFVHFYGTGVPGVSTQVDDNVFVRLDESEQRVIGLQIESFFRSATVRRPELLSLAQFADVPSEAVRDWVSRSDTQTARLGAIDSVLHDWTSEQALEE